MRTNILLTLFILSGFPLLHSQIPFQEAQLVLGDVFFLSENYITGGADAVVYQSTSAWSSTAKSLDLFKIDASFHINSLFIPESKRTFSVQNSDFNLLQVQDAESVTLPTVLGGDTTTFFNFNFEGEPVDFQSLEGVGRTQLYHPFLQASIGLWKKTELTARYSPDIEISDVEYRLFGIGIKHNMNQYFKKSTGENPIEVALQVAYSRLNSNLLLDALQLDFQDFGIDSSLSVNEWNINTDSWLFQALASKRFENFEFFGGIGIVTSDVHFVINGEETFALGLFNGLLEQLETKVSTVKSDLGVNYHFGKFYVSSILTIGEFVNYNASFHYKI